jgi:hypothetical protein
MKLIEPTKKPGENGSFQNLINQIKARFTTNKREREAENAIMARFIRSLDNRFIMFRNLHLEDTDEVFPPILIGPSGVAVLNLSHAVGFFKAKGDAWSEMDKVTQEYRPARLNLIKQCQGYIQKLKEKLIPKVKPCPDISPILIFANPRVNIEVRNPSVRIVLMDGVENLIASLVKGDEVLKPAEINFLADILEQIANPKKGIPTGDEEDFFGRDLYIREVKKSRKPTSFSLLEDLPEPADEEKQKFTRNQWILLVVMLIITILVLTGAIIILIRLFQS